MNKDNLTEFEQLRYEIMESDRISIWILGYAFIISSAILGLNKAAESNIHFNYLLLLVQFVWILSFFYISTKRFSIMTIASYIKEELENGKTSLNWETWYRKKRANKLPTPIDMYTIEMITCILPSVFIFFYLWVNHNNCEEIISGIFGGIFLCSAVYNYRKYMKLKSIVENGLDETKEK